MHDDVLIEKYYFSNDPEATEPTVFYHNSEAEKTLLVCSCAHTLFLPVDTMELTPSTSFF